MSELAEKLRRARQITVEAGGRKFTCMRPTDADMVLLSGISMVEFFKRFVVDWDDGVTELTLGIPGGTDKPVPFDADLFGEWIADQPTLWAPLAKDIKGAYSAYASKREAAEKN